MDDKYAAGLFDGEGFIRINHQVIKTSNHIRYNLYGGINMTYRPIIEKLYEEYGGSLHSRPATPPNRALFGWVIASQTAASFLRRVRPYLVVKAAEADLALEFQHNIDSNPNCGGGRKPNRQDLLNFRDDLYLRIKALKKPIFEPFSFLPYDPKISE